MCISILGAFPAHIQGVGMVHSWELTWKPKRGPIKTTVPLKRGYMGFHVSLGECRLVGLVRFV